MNSYITYLFDAQTSILLNYTLSKLIKFFMEPNTTHTSLYHTILTLRESSKNELLAQGNKKLPITYSYELIAEKVDSKLTFKLHRANLSDVEIYSIVLQNNHPSVHILKIISSILVSKYRPIPTRVDCEFSVLAKKYSEYLNCYKIKRCWQHGFIGVNTFKKPYDKETAKNANNSYTSLKNDVETLLIKYRVFTKILIDIYQNNSQKQIIYKQHEYIMWVENTEYGISVIVDNNIDQTSYNEVVKVADYSPATFNQFPRIVVGAVNCITPMLSKRKK